MNDPIEIANGAWLEDLVMIHESEASAGESQRDSIHQPRVASPRATLGLATIERTTLKGLCHDARYLERNDATPLRLKIILHRAPRVGARGANPGLNDAIPLGLSEGLADLWVKTRLEGRAPLPGFARSNYPR